MLPTNNSNYKLHYTDFFFQKRHAIYIYIFFKMLIKYLEVTLSPHILINILGYFRQV